VIQGKRAQLSLALTCLLAEGHLLIEDVPGVGKTSLAKALAASMGASWNRVQFTPDLLPSDLTGVAIWNQGRSEFEFRPGPVFANVVVGDEINRASPKTQSALLEVMEERQVTSDSVTRPVPRPFMVVATQNPIDLDGTYRLPEAQLDRFLMRVELGYPDEGAEAEILASRAQAPATPEARAVVSTGDVATMIEVATLVHVATDVSRYIVALAGATRALPELRLGASPRASLALMRAAQVRAAIDGRDFVAPGDVKALAGPVLAHRLILTPEAELDGRSTTELVGVAVDSVAPPDVRTARHPAR
jgi:MoxR-like ATPase